MIPGGRHQSLCVTCSTASMGALARRALPALVADTLRGMLRR